MFLLGMPVLPCDLAEVISHSLFSFSHCNCVYLGSLVYDIFIHLHWNSLARILTMPVTLNVSGTLGRLLTSYLCCLYGTQSTVLGGCLTLVYIKKHEEPSCPVAPLSWLTTLCLSSTTFPELQQPRFSASLRSDFCFHISISIYNTYLSMPELFESNLMSATSIRVTTNDKIIILTCE